MAQALIKRKITFPEIAETDEDWKDAFLIVGSVTYNDGVKIMEGLSDNVMSKLREANSADITTEDLKEVDEAFNAIAKYIIGGKIPDFDFDKGESTMIDVKDYDPKDLPPEVLNKVVDTIMEGAKKRVPLENSSKTSSSSEKTPLPSSKK